jgi:hypothetical protein
LSLGPPKGKPVLVGFSYIFIDIAAKFFLSVGGGTKIELAFIDGKAAGSLSFNSPLLT